MAERPSGVEGRSRIGDRELDTITGARRPGVVGGPGIEGHVMERVEGKTASAVTQAVTRRRRPIRDRVHACTADNGKEFAGHPETADAPGADFCFATPCHFRERGLNGHTNGLVHPYFPTGTDFRQVTESRVRAVEDRINGRPRKVLGYRPPAEVFAGTLAPP